MTPSCGTYTRGLRDRPASARIDGERVRAFLRRMHPTNTAAEVSVRTGIPVRTAESYLASCPAIPSAVSLLRLIAAYGPDFLCAIMADPPAWLSRAKAETRRAALEAERAAIERQLAELSDISGEGDHA